MLAKIGQMLITYLIKPLLIDAGKALMTFVKSWNEKRKRKKDSKKKKEKHQNAKTKADQSDSFSKLP